MTLPKFLGLLGSSNLVLSCLLIIKILFCGILKVLWQFPAIVFCGVIGSNGASINHFGYLECLYREYSGQLENLKYPRKWLRFHKTLELHLIPTSTLPWFNYPLKKSEILVKEEGAVYFSSLKTDNRRKIKKCLFLKLQ